MRAVIFHPHTRDAIRRFPKDVRERLGRMLFRLQLGERVAMPNSRPMPTVATGVSELRVNVEHGAYRVFYFTASKDGVLVFHAFAKRSQRTPSREIQRARQHLRELLDAKA